MALPDLLHRLLTTPGPSGHEGRVRAVWAEAAGAFAEVTSDAMGSAVARVPGKADGPTVALVGHIDEIGVLVTHVEDSGQVAFATVGYSPDVLVGQRVLLLGRDGEVPGVIGRRRVPPEESRDRGATKLSDLHIDIAARDGADARARVRVGDAGVLASEPIELANGRYAGRAMDNRIGAYVVLEAARRIAEAGGAAGDLLAVASVQEEIGSFGARAGAFGLAPDVAIAVDITPASDVPGGDPRTSGKVELGGGPAIDRAPTMNPGLIELLLAVAEDEGIAVSFEISTRLTHTDADEIHLSRGGVPTALVSVPLRYTHSPVELVQLGRRGFDPPRRFDRPRDRRHDIIRPMTRSVIVSAVRTPFGRLGGGLKGHEATELGAVAIRAALERAGIEAGEVEYVIMGQVLQGGAGQAPARQAAVGAGLPVEVPADTINKVCASSIRAVEIADSMIRAGDVEVVVTGGMESMSNAPYVLKKARFGYRLGDGSLIDLMTHDGLTSSFDGRHMVEQASFVSRELGISREEQDLWALRSHERAVAAQDAGRFDDELVPVGDADRRRGPAPRHVDRAAGVAEAGLRSGGDDDGRQRARRQRRRLVRRRLLGGVRAAAWPRAARDDRSRRAMSQTSSRTSRARRRRRAQVALERAGTTIGEVKRVELNEAFASVALNSARLLGADPEIVNVNGGAVALGHPIGASGGRILATMVHDLRRSGGGLGLAAICSGGGQGDAILLEV